VGTYERLASLALGTTLAAYGLFRAQRGRLPLAALGAAVASRGVTGRCQVYGLLGVNTAAPNNEHTHTVIPAKHGYKVEKAVTINRPAAELYEFWRNLKNLPKVMRHLRRVEVTDGERSHWVADGALGRAVEWDAEIYNDRAGEVIAWRSLPGGDVDTAGSVHFKTLSHGRGTEVAVSLKYDPPAGKVGAWIASLTGGDLERRVADDLRNFKRFMEARELPCTEGQPRGGE
jgi:uncharacterized membrane protein